MSLQIQIALNDYIDMIQTRAEPYYRFRALQSLPQVYLPIRPLIVNYMNPLPVFLTRSLGGHSLRLDQILDLTLDALGDVNDIFLCSLNLLGWRLILYASAVAEDTTNLGDTNDTEEEVYCGQPMVD
jgi:hypothetical protein